MNRTNIFCSKIKISMTKPSFQFFNLSTSSSISNHSCKYDLTTCIASLQSCAHQKNLKNGQLIHSYLLKTGLFNFPFSTTSLINMYSKCHQMNLALSVFNNLSFQPNVFHYNVMISGFYSNGFASKGLTFFRKMRGCGVSPDKSTFSSLIMCCCDVIEIQWVKEIHGLVFKLGLDLDVFIGSALVNTYSKLQLIEHAQQLFEELPVKNVVLWNAMFTGFSKVGKLKEALEVFRRMSEEGVSMDTFTLGGVLSVFTKMGHLENGIVVHGTVVKMGYDSDVAVMTALIDMYGKCNCLGDAVEIFGMMEEKNIISWTTIMAVHGLCGDHDGTLMLFSRMLRSRIQPNLVTIATVLPACSHLAALMHGRQIHGYMIVNGLAKDGNCEDINDVILNNAVMDMYAKCGNMRNAFVVFDKMTKKDVASWNIMIMGYGLNRRGKEALKMFSHLCEAEVSPDEVTFQCVLSACSHSGLVSQGCEILEQMESKYTVIPTTEHYVCVLDMLGRAGQLKEAIKLALTLPAESIEVWRTLLAACRLHGNVDLAEIAAQKVFKLDPRASSNYVLMSIAYAAAGRHEEALDVRRRMEQQNIWKSPGYSAIELKNAVHTFNVGDRSHVEANSIYAGLHWLTNHISEDEHVPNI